MYGHVTPLMVQDIDIFLQNCCHAIYINFLKWHVKSALLKNPVHQRALSINSFMDAMDGKPCWLAARLADWQAGGQRLQDGRLKG